MTTTTSLSLWLALPLCLGVGAWCLWWLADRATDDRRLRWILLGSFGLRAALGIVLYAISYYQLPLLSSLQHGEPGFLTFGLDAHVYHTLGARIAEAWRLGIDLPNTGTLYDYLAIIAAVYWLLGTHPLYAILLHAWLGALTGWLAYRIGQKLFDARSALRAACFVSFWPSSMLWSSQILKDPLSWCLVLTILWLVTLVVGPDSRSPTAPGTPQPPRWWPLRAWWRRALQILALAGATILLTRLRIYLGSILSVVALVTLLPAGCAYLFNRHVGRAVWQFIRTIRHAVGRAVGVGSVIILMIGAVVVARNLNTSSLFSPAHPEKGRVRLALQHQQRGDLALAEAEFRRAIDLRLDYREAYLLWAGMLSAAHRPQEALIVCASWPGPDSDGRMNRCVNQLWDSLEAQKSAELEAIGIQLQQRTRALEVGRRTRALEAARRKRALEAGRPKRALEAGLDPSLLDTIAPTAPTVLEAHPFSNTQISLSWAASIDNVGVTDYSILRDNTLIGASPGLSYQDIGLTPRTSYTYIVVAVDAAGNFSDETPAVQATTPSFTRRPSLPITDLLAHWPLDHQSGTIATETSDQYPHGRLQNGPRWIRGQFGNALSFDGVNDYVDAGPIPPVTANFTVAGWLYRRENPPPRTKVTWYSQGLDGTNGWAVYVHERGGRFVHGFLKGGVAKFTSDVPSAHETWEHVAWVVDAEGRQLRLYLNGTLVADIDGPIPIRPAEAGTNTYLGANRVPPMWKPDDFFPGALDDVRLYSVTLASAELAELARSAPKSEARETRRPEKPRARRKETPPKAVEAEPAKPVPEPAKPVPEPAETIYEPPKEVVNMPPEVETWGPRTFHHPQTIVLEGTVKDDGNPTNTMTYEWSQTLGPPARLASPNTVKTRVQLPEHARYQFRLMVSDGALTTFDDLFVTVEPLSVKTLAPQLATRGGELAREMSPAWLGGLRKSIILQGGHGLVDEGVDISHPLSIMAYLPRALALGFLAPFPWQWLDTQGSTGKMRGFAGVEMTLFYLLLFGVARRAWRAIRQRGVVGSARHAIQGAQLGTIFLLVYGLVTAASVSLVVANLGTLFRLRLLFWLPLLILIAAGDPLGSYRWYRRLVRSVKWRGRRHVPAVDPARSDSGPPMPVEDQHGHKPADKGTEAATSPQAVAGPPGERSG